MRKIIGSLIMILILFSVGCGKTLPAPKPLPSAMASQNQKIAQEISRSIRLIDGVKDVTTVVSDKNISTAIKVTGFDRLYLKTIKKTVHMQLHKRYPGYAVHVTSDKKLFKELRDMEVQISKGHPPGDLNNRLKKINDKMSG